ncbi:MULTISPECIES: hypothetical protein [unclassified Mesorhizobium]|uniref:phage pre-tape measure protein n=1 Tax=unclassified Mesorhizobium TaxID=325217 RepID=UPI000FE42353|nr:MULTISPECIES: hypothetical protein [unclassified Mesorhizobium]RWF33717.1 MAG: hypothetical protein EOS45_01945 [Mesorhizobium sp.]RWX68922.1 hypothetical protein EN780_07820 [Mesorhizobium sp. M4B.F.Ca.ET.089.01.1.1]
MSQMETWVIPSETVTFGTNVLKVYGLSLQHITHIVRHHRAVMADLYTQAISGKLDVSSAEQLAVGLIDDFAPLASLVIACGIGEPENADRLAKMNLPLIVQIDALDKIIRLTIVAEGGLGKLLEIVTRVMAAQAKLPSLKTSIAG